MIAKVSKPAMSKARGKVIYLVKANDELISYCRCPLAITGAPAQMDCPWCGCGWLFVCASCRKAFTFARAQEVELTWEELAHKDLYGKYASSPSSRQVKDWISFMKILLKGIERGKEYVYIDGWIFLSDSKNLRFEGWYAHHQFDVVPQFGTRHNRAAIAQSLDSKEYWESRKLI